MTQHLELTDDGRQFLNKTHLETDEDFQTAANWAIAGIAVMEGRGYTMDLVDLHLIDAALGVWMADPATSRRLEQIIKERRGG